MSLVEPFPRETRLEAGGAAKGVAVAVVVQNKDDSGHARVKVSYPWHSDERESYWARIAAPMAGKDRGVYFLPEIGDEVLVAFERGDVRFPYVLGGLWNGKESSPETNADERNDVRVIKSRKGHKLTFNDGQQAFVRLELSDGKKLQFDDDGIVLDDGQGNSVKIESRSGAVTLQAATSLSLKAPKVSIESTGPGEFKANATLTLKGALVQIN